MGGILSGLIGGMAKGALGGVTAEGERRRKEDELSKSILTQFHMNRLQDWEKLSPSEQNESIQGLTKIHPGMGKYLPQLVGIAQAVHPIIQAQMPKQSVQAPEFGQRPADIPFDVQDMRPAPALPKPAIAPNAPLAPVPTMESLSRQIGADPNNMSHNQRAMLQAEILKQNQSEQARQEGTYYKNQELENKLQAQRAAGVPEAEITKMRQSADFPGYLKSTMPQGTFGKEGLYKVPGDENLHVVRVNSKNPSLMHDDTTNQDFHQLPEGYQFTAQPRDWAPYVNKTQEGQVQLVEKGGPNKGKVTNTAARGFKQYPPTTKVQDFTTEGEPRERFLTTPEARAESKQEGGFAKYPTVDINLSNHARRMLATSAGIKTQIQEMQQLLGPFAGRVTQAEIKAGHIPGIDPATGQAIAQKARKLDASFQSFAALNPKLHGFRSIKSFDEFMAAGPHWAEDPEMALGALEGLDETIGNFVIKGKQKGANIAPPPAAALTAVKRIVQRSKKTGEYRHSEDGGQTWQPGQ